MTRNQIEYWNLQEMKRSNLSREQETERSNQAKEKETRRTNISNELLTATRNDEIKRSNLENERQGRTRNATEIASLLKDTLVGNHSLLDFLSLLQPVTKYINTQTPF